jgi:hypothetical protein
MSQREAIWRSYSHHDLAISRVKRSQFFHHNIIKIQDHGVASFVDTNPTSKEYLNRSSYKEMTAKIMNMYARLFVCINPWGQLPKTEGPRDAWVVSMANVLSRGCHRMKLSFRTDMDSQNQRNIGKKLLFTLLYLYLIIKIRSTFCLPITVLCLDPQTMATLPTFPSVVTVWYFSA